MPGPIPPNHCITEACAMGLQGTGTGQSAATTVAFDDANQSYQSPEPQPEPEPPQSPEPESTPPPNETDPPEPVNDEKVKWYMYVCLYVFHIMYS